MPVFVRNLNLEFLTEKGLLKNDRMQQMYEQAKWRHAHGAYYLTYAMPSGVQFIFKTVQDGENLRVVGTDTHLSGRCTWNAIPFMNVTPPDSDDLTAVVALTNVAQDGVFIAHLMNAAVLPTIEEGQSLAMQMAAFPLAVAVYDSREAYEIAASKATVDDGQPIILSDRRVFPLNFMLKHDPDVPEDQRNQNLRDDIMLVCGPILEVQRKVHVDEDSAGASFLVATISTQFGHLDVAFTTDMLAQASCEKGQYLVFSGIFSANVAIEGFENWLED